MSNDSHRPAPQTPDSHEQALLQHYRAHSQEQPSAALDARILALAAVAAKARSEPPPSALARLHAWLFGASQRRRWSVAVAGLASLGLGLGLTLRTLERAPSAYDAPAPAAMQAPALESIRQESIQQYAAPAPLEKKMAERRMAAESPAAPAALADVQQPLAEDAAQAKTAPSASQAGAPFEAEAQAQAAAKAKPDAELERALRQVLALRRDAQEEAAAARLEALQRRYPRLDLQAELERLQAAPGQEP